MRDLELWRRIARGDATADDLAPIAPWPLARRAAHVGLIATLATHGDPAVRSSAISALAGARGVPGLRLIVDALADPEPAVWAAAVAALRATAKDAPYRYVHALFHPRAEVRRAALTAVPHGATEPAAYLRADPACADLAAMLPWPDKPLPLAFELHRAGAITSDELLRLIGASAPFDLRAYLEAERGRDAETVDAYFAACRDAGALVPLAGEDPCDSLARALDEASPHDRAAQTVFEAVTLKRPQPIARRFVAALLGRIAQQPSRVAVMIAAALEPLAIPLLPRAHADGIAAGLLRYAWPVKPGAKEVQALLAVPWIAADLAVAAAIAGLFTGKRLKRLKRALGEAAILASLLADGRGWEQILRLPAEKPPLELAWLAKTEEHPVRHAELAGHALAVLSGKRLEEYVDHLQRRHRAPAFLALCTQLSPDDAKLAAAAAVMAPRLERTHAGEVLAHLLSSGDRGLHIALVYARALTDKQLASAAKLVDDAALARFVVVLDGFDALPRDREVALAQAVVERPHPAVRAWAERVTRVVVSAPSVPLPAIRARRDLDPAQRHAIATAADKDLEAALAPALVAPCTGLCEALALRRGNPSVAACAALLGSADPIADVAHQLDRFGTIAPRFVDELDNAAIAVWRTGTELPPLVHARLWRWEAHIAALARWTERAGGVLAALRGAFELGGVLAADTLGKGIAELVMFSRYRDKPRFAIEATPELATYCAKWIDHPVHGKHAARIVVALVEAAAVRLGVVKEALLERAADADVPTRELLARLVRMEGMPEPPRAVVDAPAVDLIAQIRSSRDLDALAAWCTEARTTVVQEAVLGLLMLGEAGQLRLAELVARAGELPAPVPLLASVALWDSEAALSAARTLAARGGLPPEWQFHLCIGLGDGPGAIAAARAPSDGAWFTRRDWDALVKLVAPVECALALVDAAHHHAYASSLAVLLDSWDDEAALRDAFVRFLEVDAQRPIELRRRVARRLAKEFADFTGLPILVEEVIDEGVGDVQLDYLTRESGTLIAQMVVDAALIGGHGACTEKRMWHVLERMKKHAMIEPAVLPPLYVRILEGGSTALARRTAAQLAVGDSLVHARLGQIAEAFAWGVRRGVELTGRLMRIHLTSAEKDLGHTFLTESRIFVSPLPMLRDEPHGRDVVEGLILHELGHHAYHRGEEAQALWKQAHQEGIGHLLNLVADEHLERNLRAVDRAYGDRLKRLDAYAFQHAAQELQVKLLLDALRVHAAAALSSIELGVAFDEASVRIRRGAVMSELEKTGHPLARFARALRMGLGNRFEDPRVATALAMCKDVRKLDMRQMYELTKRLAALFGGSIAIARVFGGPEGLGLGETEREQDVHGSGIDDNILQREVERILDPKKTTARTGKLGPRDHLQINVNPDEAFDKITTVVRVRGDAAEHRRLAADVNRHAVRLRKHLDDLGLRWEPAKARIKGHALDRGRLRSLVTRGDPKILVARSPMRKTDLFLGTIVDCSGSMQAGQNIERAKKFGVLIAEAVRPLPGVEARFFGFTDSVIYDAGDARECDVTALEADGGNNDAAALHHVANIAAASHKRARVLVMISDGLPTECSVAAVKGLVTSLTKRKGMVCAQVAVRPLEEELFPNYVVLDDSEIDVAIARFGRMIGDLTRKALM